MPPPPPMRAAAVPPFPSSAPAMPFGGAPARGDSEAARLAAEKDKLENKIAEMEKTLAAEKEKALLAALKSQQDEALSSRVESSLKDIQEKMRRDRREGQIEEERIALKGKIKELEGRLAQERETWMQTLKNQLAERETQGRDIESHFVYRLQEMERRWLEEKAQWQKDLMEREETIRSMKAAAERLAELQVEYRRLSLDKEMSDKEAAKLREEVARGEREKASVESFIKSIPEKERALAEARAEVSMARMREEALKAEVKAAEEKAQAEIRLGAEKNRSEIEKMRAEIGRLQAELGTLSDRKNAEMNAELEKQREAFAAEAQEKDKALADLAGEKMRAISELLKVKGFVSRVQAVNAAMDKERGQLRLEKMQLAQQMAAQLEELKKMRQEADMTAAAREAELARAKAAHAEELDKAHREEIARLEAAFREEKARMAAQFQADIDNKIFQLRSKYDAASEEGKIAVRRQLEEDYNRQIKDARVAVLALEGEKTTLAMENNKLLERMKEYDEKAAKVEAERRRVEALAAMSAAQKAEAEKAVGEFNAERAALTAKMTALEKDLEAAAASFKAEHEARVRLESEMNFVKQRVEEQDGRAREMADAFESERAGYAAQEAAAREEAARLQEAVNAMSAQLSAYESFKASLGSRLKWALKGWKQ